MKVFVALLGLQVHLGTASLEAFGATVEDQEAFLYEVSRQECKDCATLVEPKKGECDDKKMTRGSPCFMACQTVGSECLPKERWTPDITKHYKDPKTHQEDLQLATKDEDDDIERREAEVRQQREARAKKLLQKHQDDLAVRDDRILYLEIESELKGPFTDASNLISRFLTLDSRAAGLASLTPALSSFETVKSAIRGAISGAKAQSTELPKQLNMAWAEANANSDGKLDMGLVQKKLQVEVPKIAALTRRAQIIDSLLDLLSKVGFMAQWLMSLRRVSETTVSLNIQTAVATQLPVPNSAAAQYKGCCCSIQKKGVTEITGPFDKEANKACRDPTQKDQLAGLVCMEFETAEKPLDDQFCLKGDFVGNRFVPIEAGVLSPSAAVPVVSTNPIAPATGSAAGGVVSMVNVQLAELNAIVSRIGDAVTKSDEADVTAVAKDLSMVSNVVETIVARQVQDVKELNSNFAGCQAKVVNLVKETHMSDLRAEVARATAQAQLNAHMEQLKAQAQSFTKAAAVVTAAAATIQRDLSTAHTSTEGHLTEVKSAVELYSVKAKTQAIQATEAAKEAASSTKVSPQQVSAAMKAAEDEVQAKAADKA